MIAAEELGTCWSDLRGQTPLVHCLTNVVVTPFVANVLLASGAAPAMVDNPHEAGDFAQVAGAVSVNLGTPQEQTVEGMRRAVAAAGDAGTPWVLDPVAAGGLAWRTEVARELLALRTPRVVRGNASEILGLEGSGGGRGVDSTDAVEDAVEAARAMAGREGTVVAVSGEVDQITDGDRLVQVPHGHPWMTRVTGVGCALGALMAACSAVAEDGMVAATTATVALTLAAETAAEGSRGPGSFAVALLDELHALEPEELVRRVGLR